MPLGAVVIVGAPNVGKSTLFNRLVRRRTAIVTAEPGATRDRLYGEIPSSGAPIRVVDTGGLTGSPGSPLESGIAAQVQAAIEEADLAIFVVDVRTGPSPVDREIATMLRRRSLPVLVVANKADSTAQEALAAEFYDLGLGDPIPVSAIHGSGIDQLLDEILVRLHRPGVPQPMGPVEPPAPSVRVALVGRPNVGKSSLLNRLLGEERHLVSELPGTTRDPVDTLLVRGQRRYVLVDTAGIRRKGRVHHESEILAVQRAEAAIRRCDVAVLVLDASEGFAAQDAHIAGYALEARKPIVVAVNKWDVLDQREEKAKEWSLTIRERLKFLRNAPVIFVSAATSQRVAKILDLVDTMHAAAGIRVPTPELNRWLQRAAHRERSSPAVGRSVRLLYTTQTGTHPPRFVIFCSDPQRVHFSLRRQLENSLRAEFGFGGAAIRLQFRGRRAEAGRG